MTLEASRSRNILLTGYWPPTNEMLRQFSTSRAANPDGWRGRDWRGKGFDIHAFFPEFEPGCEIKVSSGDSCWVGSGDLRVDYAATLRDFRRITATIRPCAIITFSRGGRDSSWEIEGSCRNLGRWRPDASRSGQPDPAPPDPTFPPDAGRPSTLPMEEIARRVEAAGLDLRVFIDRHGGTGAFLSEFIGYLGTWYQARHGSATSSSMCVAAGHIHVGIHTELSVAVEATEITLEALIDHVQGRLPTTGDTPRPKEPRWLEPILAALAD